jgi:hypothetical protein
MVKLNNMNFQYIALSNWNNGVLMIAIFVLVCIALIGFLIKSMVSNDRDRDEPTNR